MVLMTYCYGKIAVSLAEPFGFVTLFVYNLYCTYQMCIYLQSKNIECVGTVRFNNLPPSLKILFTAFKKVKCIEVCTWHNELPVTQLHTKAYEINGVFYIFVKDNGEFTMATNSKALFDKGWIRKTNRLDEKQRLRLGIAIIL